MKAPEDHKRLLALRDYPLRVSNEGIFTPDELTLLKKQGHWLEALANGTIPPITVAQERFVRVCRGELQPETVAERGWTRLVGRRELEPELGREFELTDPGEEWFRREAHWRYH